MVTMMMRTRWTVGNRIELLENGETYFPRVFDAIDRARHEVIIETFILFDDTVGRALRAALIDAARRGVRVDLMIDGFGSPDLSKRFIGGLVDAGARVRVFDPAKRVFGWRVNILRRLHRKIVLVDGEQAFVGGINFSEEHLLQSGPKAKQDYAVALAGPIVAEIHRFAVQAIAEADGEPGWARRPPESLLDPSVDDVVGPAEVAFVTRDNRQHTNDIERHYLAALRAARRRVLIANAYFFPGHRMVRELRRAAKRGVDVVLVLQGEPDMPLAKAAAGLLYHHLLDAGVSIHEYCERPLHGKVALTDDVWSTVGSSNLDPTSLTFNLEANVVIRDVSFNRELGERLGRMIRDGCSRVTTDVVGGWTPWRRVRSFVLLHVLRWYPTIGRWLPPHAPRVERLDPRRGDGPRAGAA